MLLVPFERLYPLYCAFTMCVPLLTFKSTCTASPNFKSDQKPCPHFPIHPYAFDNMLLNIYKYNGIKHGMYQFIHYICRLHRLFSHDVSSISYTRKWISDIHRKNGYKRLFTACVTHYYPRSDFPYYNLTTPNRDGTANPWHRDMLCRSVSWALVLR